MTAMEVEYSAQADMQVDRADRGCGCPSIAIVKRLAALLCVSMIWSCWPGVSGEVSLSAWGTIALQEGVSSPDPGSQVYYYIVTPRFRVSDLCKNRNGNLRLEYEAAGAPLRSEFPQIFEVGGIGVSAQDEWLSVVAWSTTSSPTPARFPHRAISEGDLLGQSEPFQLSKTGDRFVGVAPDLLVELSPVASSPCEE